VLLLVSPFLLTIKIIIMKKVKFTKDTNFAVKGMFTKAFSKGDVVNLSDGDAAVALSADLAEVLEEVKEEQSVLTEKKEPAKPKRKTKGEKAKKALAGSPENKSK